MAIRKLVPKDTEVLHKPSQEISEFRTEHLLSLTRDMKETMVKEEGIGLAAPQIGEPLRLFVVDLEYIRKVDEDETSSGMSFLIRLKKFLQRKIPYIYINPVIRYVSPEKTSMEEGCLSVPGIFGMTDRPKEIVIEAKDEQGKKHRIRAKGLLAKVLQHETDHVNGILFIEKAEQDTLHEVKREKE